MTLCDNKHYSATTIVTPPTVEPVSLGEVQNHLRISSNDETALLNNLIASAREQFENRTGLRLLTQTWKAFYSGWPDEYFIVPSPPLQSVTHVKYYGTDGTEYTWDSSNYIVDTDRTPGRVTLGYSKSWPSTTLYPSNPVEIQFVCGYGATAANVPYNIKTAILFLIEQMYDRPDDKYDATLSRTVESILINSRVAEF